MYKGMSVVCFSPTLSCCCFSCEKECQLCVLVLPAAVFCCCFSCVKECQLSVTSALKKKKCNRESQLSVSVLPSAGFFVCFSQFFSCVIKGWQLSVSVLPTAGADLPGKQVWWRWIVQRKQTPGSVVWHEGVPHSGRPTVQKGCCMSEVSSVRRCHLCLVYM